MGEFADEYSERDLADDLDVDQDSEDGQAIMDDAANAYNDAASEAFWHEVERMARKRLRRQYGPVTVKRGSTPRPGTGQDTDSLPG